jgi:hypothetical protein
MRFPKILHRTDWNNPGGIDIVVREVIMTLDVVEIHRLGNTIQLIKIA